MKHLTPKNIYALVILALLAWGVARGELTAIEAAEKVPHVSE